MGKLHINLILLILVILVLLFDVLRNIRFLKSKKMIVSGVLTYASILAFFICFVFFPSNTLLLISIIAVGIYPSACYRYHRTTKEEKKREA
jgi:phosphatidylserine synthase